MANRFQSGIRLFVLSAMLFIGLAASAQTFSHTIGNYSALKANKFGINMQEVHELVQVVYATPGQQVTLSRPSPASFPKYLRWYDYQTDNAVASGLTTATTGRTLTGRGAFYYTENANDATYIMPSDGQVHYIACDHSSYTNGVYNSSTIQEPTLSQRVIFEIRPASEMAALADAATGDNWLETYNMIAPTTNNLYIGPKYGFFSGAQYLNYFFNASSPTQMNSSSWDGGVQETITDKGWVPSGTYTSTTSYVCIKAYDVTNSANSTLSASTSGTGQSKTYFWTNGTSTKNGNTWTVANWDNDDRTYSVSIGAKRTVTQVDIVLRGKNKQYTVNFNGSSVGNGTTSKNQNTTTFSKSGLSYSNTTLSINVTNAQDIIVQSIKIYYTNVTESHLKGDILTSEPAATYCGNWMKQVTYSGSVTETKRIVDEIRTKDGWLWTRDGVKVASPTVASGQFIKVSESEAGEHVYCLTYSNSAYSCTTTIDSSRVKTGTHTVPYLYIGGEWVEQQSDDQRTITNLKQDSRQESNKSGTKGAAINVAKFVVNYMTKNTVGPVANVKDEEDIVNDSKMVAEMRFNYSGQAPTTYSGSTVYPAVLPSDESSYGFFSGIYPRKNNPEPGEYAFINQTNFVHWCGTSYSYLKNHTLKGEASPLDGYMLYVDGSHKPGDVVNLKFSADLCPGAKMYFSAYVGDVSTSGKSAPNLDFVLTGIDEYGVSHDLATYTTGEFGGNGNDAFAQWLHILFPFEFVNDVDFASYHLKITNKGKDGYGNDFVIDDIQIYVQNPPVLPIQASTQTCPDAEGVTDSYAYLRVDYKAFDDIPERYYYQWRNSDNQVITNINYLNKAADNKSGWVPVTASPLLADIYTSVADFDESVQNHTAPHSYGYVNERCSDGNLRYVLYIAQPMTLKVNYMYYGYVAAAAAELGPQNECSSTAELVVAAGVTFKLDDVIIASDETQTVCGSEPGTLQMVYRYVERNVSTGKLVNIELTDVTADWLYGDEAFINANASMYCGYTYAQIVDAIDDYRAGSPSAASVTIFNNLVKAGVLTPNTSSIAPNMSNATGDDVVVYYTAFPMEASISGKTGDKVPCIKPSTFSFKLGGGASTVSIVSTDSEWDQLPTYVKLNPRRIRVSENTIAAGTDITFKVHLSGVGTEQYRCNSAELVSSTDAAAASHLVDNKIGLVFTNESGETDLICSTTSNVALTGTSDLQPGHDYTFRFLKTRIDDAEDCNVFNSFITLRIVPAIVTWEGKDGAAWNNDLNWDTYAPLPDTKVVLRSEDYILPDMATTIDNVQSDPTYEEGAGDYISYDINYATSQCADLYIPVGATLLNQHRLTVNGKVYIDLPVYGKKWSLTSFPIQGVVAGDLFIPTSENDGASQPFNVAAMSQTEGADATDRSLYPLYVSLYNQKSTFIGSQKEIVSATFTSTINDLTQSFPTGMGTSIKAGFEGNSVIRLPKQDDTYHYYQYGAWISENENIARDANYGKPAYLPTGEDGVNGMDITLTNNSEGDWFLFGNPTFANIDIKKFIDGNSSVLAGPCALMTLVGATNRNSVIPATYQAATGKYLTANGDQSLTMLPVGCSMLFQTKASAKSLTLNLTPEMLISNGGQAGGAKHVRGMNENKEIAISLRHNSITSSSCYVSYALLREDAEASEAFVEGEDAEAMLLEAAKTRFAIYTTADDKACSINQISSETTTVPLAVYSTYKGKISMEYLCFEGDNEYLSEWDLVRLSDDTRIPLYDSLTLEVVMPLDGSVDYVLEHARKAPAVPTEIEQLDSHNSLSVYTSDGYLFAYSSEDMCNFSIYDASGRLVAQEKNAGTTAQFYLPAGVYMVRANGQTTKAIVK